NDRISMFTLNQVDRTSPEAATHHSCSGDTRIFFCLFYQKVEFRATYCVHVGQAVMTLIHKRTKPIHLSFEEKLLCLQHAFVLFRYIKAPLIHTVREKAFVLLHKLRRHIPQ